MDEISIRPPLGGLFSLVVKHAGAAPTYDYAQGQATARVAILHGPEGKCVVLMTDGNYGSSITNCAEELLSHLYCFHLAPLGIQLDDTRWIYRDTDGSWDEILPGAVHGPKVYLANYRPLGGRTEADALNCIAAEGVALSEDEMAALGAHLGLSLPW